MLSGIARVAISATLRKLEMVPVPTVILRASYRLKSHRVSKEEKRIQVAKQTTKKKKNNQSKDTGAKSLADPQLNKVTTIRLQIRK